MFQSTCLPSCITCVSSLITYCLHLCPIWCSQVPEFQIRDTLVNRWKLLEFVNITKVLQIFCWWGSQLSLKYGIVHISTLMDRGFCCQMQDNSIFYWTIGNPIPITLPVLKQCVSPLCCNGGQSLRHFLQPFNFFVDFIDRWSGVLVVLTVLLFLL